jgi:DNA processing protein
VPGSIQHPGARGCHQLIRDGASLVEGVEDILQQLRGWQRVIPPKPAAPQPDQAEHPLLALLWAAPHSSEALAVASGWPMARVLAELTELEINGRVACQAGIWSGLGE